MGKNILCLILFAVGSIVLWYQTNVFVYLAIFALLWGNNIGLMNTVENMKKNEKSILKILFGDNISDAKIQEIMSQKIKVSDK